MSLSMSRPDTIYLQSNITFFEDVQQDLVALHNKLTAVKCSALTRFKRLLADSDYDLQWQLRNMTVNEAEEYIADLDEENEDSNFEKIKCVIGGHDFFAYHWSPRSGMPFMIENDLFRIHINPRNVKNTPNIFLEIGQIALWSNDWREVVIKAVEFFNVLGLNPDIKISRLDLATHTQEINSDDLQYSLFKTRSTNNKTTAFARVSEEFKKRLQELEYIDSQEARSEKIAELQKEFDCVVEMLSDGIYVTWHNGMIVQQISFGRRSSKNPYARLYVKSREVTYSPIKKKVFHSIWSQAGFDLEKEVINVEFEMTRDCLRRKQFHVETKTGKTHSFYMETVEDLLQNFDNMLLYLMGPKGYLQKVVPTKDQTRSRWPVCKRWVAMFKQLKKVKKVKFTYMDVAAKRSEIMDKTTLSYLFNFYLARCQEEHKTVDITDNMMKELEESLKVKAIEEIIDLAMSPKYSKYIRNKIETQAIRLGVNEKTIIEQNDYKDYYAKAWEG